MNFFEQIKDYLNKPNESDFFVLFNNIQFDLSSGIPVQDSLKKIANSEVMRQKPLGKAIGRISKNLSIGMNVGDAFTKEKIFPKIVPPIVAAGERAGQLTEAFMKLAEVMWMEHNLYSKVKGTLLMPKIASVLMVGLIVGFVKFALPQYASMYEDQQIEMPFVLTTVSTTVNAIVDYWPVTLVLIALLIYGVKKFAQTHRPLMDKIRLKFPVYKRLHFLFIQHQFITVLSLMISSGLTMTEAFKQASHTVDNYFMVQSLHKVQREYLTGMSLEKAFARHNKPKVFDDALLSSLVAGEAAGQVSKSLEIAEKYYSRMLNNEIDPVATKITCMVLIPMGILIIGMYLFMMMPMFDFMSKIKA